MLSPNAVFIDKATLGRDQYSHPLTGPVVAHLDGIGYEFIAPVSSWEWSPFDNGWLVPSSVSLFTHCAQSAEGQTWFAFSHRDEKQMALTMAKADKVGVRTAVKILAGTSYLVIQDLINSGDRATFKQLPGVGPKTGDKIIDVLFVEAPLQSVKEKPVLIVVDEDAVSGLRALGYKAERAREAVTQAVTVSPGSTTPVILKAALKILNL